MWNIWIAEKLIINTDLLVLCMQNHGLIDRESSMLHHCGYNVWLGRDQILRKSLPTNHIPNTWKWFPLDPGVLWFWVSHQTLLLPFDSILLYLLMLPSDICQLTSLGACPYTELSWFLLDLHLWLCPIILCGLIACPLSVSLNFLLSWISADVNVTYSLLLWLGNKRRKIYR